MSSSNIQFDVKPWDEHGLFNKFSWKGKITKGLVIGASVHIWIIPTQKGVLPFFDQNFDFEKQEYDQLLRKYHEEMHRPSDAHHGIYQAFDWPSICLNTLDEFLACFSTESFSPFEKTNLPFRFLKGSVEEIKNHFENKINLQLDPPPKFIKELLLATLSGISGFVYEEVTDEVLFWVIENPAKMHEELCEVQQIIKRKNNIVGHC